MSIQKLTPGPKDSASLGHPVVSESTMPMLTVNGDKPRRHGKLNTEGHIGTMQAPEENDSNGMVTKSGSAVIQKASRRGSSWLKNAYWPEF